MADEVEDWGEIPKTSVSTWGKPDGPVIEAHYIGAVPTFLNPRKDLLEGTSASIGTLQHHVPLTMRGPYKLDSFPGAYGEREGVASYAMCCSFVSKNDKRVNPTGEDRLCKAKAINRSGFCSRHGGMLHPLDRKRIDWSTVSREIRFKYGKLPVEELDDEELSRGQIRKVDGSYTDNKSVSIDIHDAMVRRLFERADTRLRENLLDTVETMAEIAKGTAYEPADRIRAATWIYERIRGKVPTEVKVTQDKPFEVVIGAVLEGGSRSASRARRGFDDDPGVPGIDNFIDAELVDDGFSDEEDSDPRATAEQQAAEEAELAAHEAERAAQQERYTEQPVTLETPFGPSKAIPQDPDLRQVYEDLKESEADRVARERKEFAERMKTARGKRFGSRAKGLDHVEAYGYEIEVEDMPEDGEKATAVFWVEPVVKAPKAAEASETRRRNKERFRG